MPITFAHRNDGRNRRTLCKSRSAWRFGRPTHIGSPMYTRYIIGPSRHVRAGRDHVLSLLIVYTAQQVSQHICGKLTFRGGWPRLMGAFLFTHGGHSGPARLYFHHSSATLEETS